MFATDAHYVVTNDAKTRVLIGWTLPLTESAARKYARKNNGRALKRTTARSAGLIK